MSDEDFIGIGRSWFPPELAATLTLGRVTKELQVFGVKRPQRCGLKDALVLLAKEVLRTSRVMIKIGVTSLELMLYVHLADTQTPHVVTLLMLT